MTCRSASVVFIGYRIGLDATFGAEFVKPVELLNAGGVQSEVLVLSSLGEFLRGDLRASWANRRRGLPDAVRINIARAPIAPSRLSAYLDESRMLALALRMRYQRGKTLILHAVGSRAGHLAVRARHFLPGRNVRVLFRAVGPIADEYLYRAGGAARLSDPEIALRYDRLRTEEDLAYRTADAVVALSEPMRLHAIKRRGSAQAVTNIGCLADVAMFSRAIADRERTRNEIGSGRDLVVVHSGTLHPWQRPKEVVRLFERIYAIEPRSWLLMLTRDRKVFEDVLMGSGLPRERYKVLSLEFHEVPRYLAAADIGLIGRGLMEAPSIVNAFSSPIKFAEYLAVGCPVIMGEGIGDFSEMARAYDLGLVLPHDLDEAALQGRLRAFLNRYETQQIAWRQHCQAFAEINLDMRGSIARYMALYTALTGRNWS